MLSMRHVLAIVLLFACESEPAAPPLPAVVAVPNAVIVADAYQDAKKKTAEVEAISIHSACELYMLQKRGACPKDVAELVSSGMLGRHMKDPWDTEYEIVCDADGRIAVVSAGPDRKSKTDDDIVHKSR